jgi:hypothetical protein
MLYPLTSMYSAFYYYPKILSFNGQFSIQSLLVANQLNIPEINEIMLKVNKDKKKGEAPTKWFEVCIVLILAYKLSIDSMF